MIPCSVFEGFSARFIFNYCLLLSFSFILLSASIAAQSKSLPSNNSSVKISSDLSKLPEPVQKMRAAIMKAAETGNLKALFPVIESNEIRPIAKFGSTIHPVLYWKNASKKRDGAEFMKAMISVFNMPYAVTWSKKGKANYIWPYLAEINMKRLSEKQKRDLGKLVPASQISQMQQENRYLHYRASIGPDGTWHMFVLEE